MPLRYIIELTRDYSRNRSTFPWESYKIRLAAAVAALEKEGDVDDLASWIEDGANERTKEDGTEV